MVSQNNSMISNNAKRENAEDFTVVEDEAENNVSDLSVSKPIALGRTGSTISSSGFQKFIITFTGALETFFYRWGYNVALHPCKSIAACLLLTFVCSLGLMNLQYEDRPDKLLISQTSQLAYDTDWLRNNFPSPVRFSTVMITAENVLTLNVLLKIMEIQERTEQITAKHLKWNEICFKLPITKGIDNVKSRKRRSLDSFEEAFDDEFFKNENALEENRTNYSEDPYMDETLIYPDEAYCSYVASLDRACWITTPLELWGFNRSRIERLTQDEIVHTVNNEKISPVFGRPMNFTAELGGKIVRNEKGEIISAGSILLKWAIAVNKTIIELGQAVKDDGTGELADEVSLAWEKKWLEMMEDLESKTDKTKMNVYYFSGRSFGDIYKRTMYNDMKIVIVGYIIMYAYVAITIGRFNMLEQRPYLSAAGICCAVFAGLMTCGICSAFSLPFGNVNKVLPFLLVGVGVDDLFVIMQCFQNIYPNCLTSNYKESIPHRIGMSLKTAGASITVTSLTDMAAFLIGATTLLPGLRSFCIYAAVGIIAVLFLQVTFFVGCFALDQRRLEDRRDAFFFCKMYRKSVYVPNKWSQNSSILQVFFEKVLAKVILTKVGKICVIIITFVFIGININGNINLRQEFDPMWFLAHDSHLVKYIEAKKVHYPNFGFGGFIVGNKVNWTASFEGFEAFVKDMNNADFIYEFDPWYEDFKKYSNRNFKTDIPHSRISEKKFQTYLGKFLFSRIGSKYRQYFKAKKELTCGERASPIEISMMPFKFKAFKGRDQHIPGMNGLKKLVRNAGLTFNDPNGKMFSWSSVFVSWETDEVISSELYRNVVLSIICVLFTIFFLLFNLRMCLFCGICVAFVVVDVGGTMFYWGMSIDTISVVANVVAIGLCVDYAAHIGLAFLMSTGDKNARATQALKDIGPAVLNGGISTFVGVVLLSNSETHALQSFFKVLTTVVFFGLYHGLVFLPVLLSLIGPDPYPTTIIISKGNHGSQEVQNSTCRSKVNMQSIREEEETESTKLRV